jgi:DNA-binding HxlR family transcriptional regulator
MHDEDDERSDDGAPWFAPPPEDAEDAQEHLYRLIGSRWVASVLRVLDGRTMRYNALRRHLGGVSHKMLTQTLRRLQRAELVRRLAHGTTPPNVEYQLTPAGTELLENLARLERWARGNGLPYE